MIDSLPAGYEHFPIAVVRVFGGVDFLVHPTADTLAAAVANIRRFQEPGAESGDIVLTVEVAPAASAAKLLLSFRLAGEADVRPGAVEPGGAVVVTDTAATGTPNGKMRLDLSADRRQTLIQG